MVISVSDREHELHGSPFVGSWLYVSLFVCLLVLLVA